MDRSLAAAAQRTLAVVRVDLAVMRGEVKSLHNLARAAGTDGDVKATRRALEHLDRALRELDDPTILHPTLF